MTISDLRSFVLQIAIERGYTQNAVNAALEYVARQRRKSHPQGSFDSAGRWYPSGRDEFVMAPGRVPSRAYPLSFNKACRSADHVARLFEVDGLAVKRIARALKSLEDLAAPTTGHETMAFAALIAKALALAPGFKTPKKTKFAKSAPVKSTV